MKLQKETTSAKSRTANCTECNGSAKKDKKGYLHLLHFKMFKKCDRKSKTRSVVTDSSTTMDNSATSPGDNTVASEALSESRSANTAVGMISRESSQLTLTTMESTTENSSRPVHRRYQRRHSITEHSYKKM